MRKIGLPDGAAQSNQVEELSEQGRRIGSSRGKAGKLFRGGLHVGTDKLSYPCALCTLDGTRVMPSSRRLTSCSDGRMLRIA